MRILGTSYLNLLDSLHDGVYVVNRDRRIRFWNSSAEQITGYLSAEVVNRRCSDNILMHVDSEGRALCKEHCPLRATLQDGQKREIEAYLHHADGHRIPVLVRVAPLFNEKKQIVGAIESFNESTLRADLIERLHQLEALALLDELTQVGNRRYANITLSTRMHEFTRYGIPFGVMMVDVDTFKDFNDTYGHDIGDMVIRMVARTMQDALRTSDVLCRWGGDEFLIIVPNASEDQLQRLGDRLRGLISTSFLTESQGILKVTVSAGATMVAPDDSAETLLKRADMLLYRAKDSGRNCVLVELATTAGQEV
ncbi:MAG: Response regulator PleD [bacterium ADurb.Bin429]|nr:MAG: Response regulator PleD [bacterium ADurb.Bin429]